MVGNNRTDRISGIREAAATLWDYLIYAVLAYWMLAIVVPQFVGDALGTARYYEPGSLPVILMAGVVALNIADDAYVFLGNPSIREGWALFGNTPLVKYTPYSGNSRLERDNAPCRSVSRP